MSRADTLQAAWEKKHRGSCRVFYAENYCTCGAEPAVILAAVPDLLAVVRALEYIADAQHPFPLTAEGMRKRARAALSKFEEDNTISKG
jgi:hypothetical protein